MPVSVLRLILPALFAGLVCLVLAAAAGYFARSFEDRARLSASSTQTAAAAVEQELALARRLLLALAEDPALRRELAAKARWRAESRSLDSLLATRLPLARSLDWIPASALLTATSGDTRLEPACLEAWRRAVASGSVPAPAEAHHSASGELHYDLFQPVRDDHAETLGWLLARFEPPALSALAAASGLRLALVQERAGDWLVLASADGRQLGPETATVNQGHWRVEDLEREHWPAILAGAIPFLPAVLFVLAVSLYGSAVYGLHRRLVRGVRHDIQSLARLFSDVREGSVRPAYPMMLAEFSDIFQRLRQSGERLVKEKERLKDMGLIDHLSQLSNRRHFEMRLKELFDKRQSHGPSSLLLIDVDHFKQVNDRHGHDIGDALIVAVARELRRAVRSTDILARLGGDEFCVVYLYTPLEKAKTYAERLRRTLPRELELGKGIVHTLRWTGGLSVMTDEDERYDAVLWRADQALLAAKEAGRNLTLVYDPRAGGVVRPRVVPS
jgi:diguanylate cyclase (GGDEF)-like protein